MACLLLVLFSFAATGAAQPNDTRIATAQLAVTQALGKDTPGAAVAIVADGELLMLEGFGYADIGNGSADTRVLVTPETVFELGRLSGLFVSIAAFRLAEAGVLDLDADIDRYLPEEFMKQLNLADDISVLHLLCGTAGFEGRTFDLSFDNPAYCFDSLREALLAEIPAQRNEAGEYYSYSAFGVALAAYVIECVTGKPYEAYVAETILAPLGMTSTYLYVNGDTAIANAAKGHEKSGEGSFAVAKEDGRSYFALYPADGAFSTAADLAALLRFLLRGNTAVLSDAVRLTMLTGAVDSGIFHIAAPTLSARGNARGVTSETRAFSASLWVDPAAGVGAVVLCNTAESVLLSLPTSLCGAVLGTAVAPVEELPSADDFEGTYATLNSERHSFVGRLWRKENAVSIKANEDGTLSFLDMRLYQIAPGIFGDAEKGDGIALVQFLTDDDGDVVAVVTAAGDTYHPLAFYEHGIVATVLFYLLIGFCAWFFFAGPVSLLRWISRRRNPESDEGFRHALPDLFATLVSLFVLIQVVVALHWGAAALASVFTALTVLLLLVGIGALVSYTFSIVTSFTNNKIFVREVRTAILFVVFVMLIVFFGIVPV